MRPPLPIETLSLHTFRDFGQYTDLFGSDYAKIGAPPIEFFRDQSLQTLGEDTAVSYSTCRCAPRPRVIDTTEHHSRTCEMLLPLDQDVLMHFGPATPAGEAPPLDRFRVFRVPRGTLVVIRPGVWHHAPFATEDRPANILVALPERTYANDCVVVTLPPADQLRIA